MTKEQIALDAYWAARTPDEERDAVQKMASLGMLSIDGEVSTSNAGAEIPVTPAMIAAGEELLDAGYAYGPGSFAAAIYRSMAALAPVELAPEGERIALARVDIAEGRVKELEARLAEATQRNLILRTAGDRMVARITELDRMLAEATNRNLILRAAYDHLAQRPVAFVDPKPEAPKHNPFREFGDDRRRVGR